MREHCFSSSEQVLRITFDNEKVKLRIKQGNVGGAFLLIPKHIEQRIGYFNECFGAYSEEDACYFIRLQCAGLANAYMEDEDCFFHLPAGKAAVIDTESGTFDAKDGLEEIAEKEYRAFKDSLRTVNVPKLMALYQQYASKQRPFYEKTNAAQDFRFKWCKRAKK
jgi:hypothetical protein